MDTASSASQVRKRIACIGECLVELRADGDTSFATAFAGDTLNTATYLVRSGLHEVSFVTVIGEDEISGRMLTAWQNEGIDTQLVGRHAERLPGIYLIENDESGERTFRYWRSESAARTLMLPESGVLPESLSSHDVLYLSGITLAVMQPQAREALLAFLADFRDSGGVVSFDSNYRPRLWESVECARDWVMKMWALTDIGLPSLDDELLLFAESSEDHVSARLLDAGVPELLIKRGEQGPLVYRHGVPAEYAPLAGEVVVVDTTGAGDSFNGGYLASRLAGNDIAASVQSAHGLATRVIGHAGAILPE